ncbi:iron ABC transporter permease [Mycetocola tolaasinivorans]|uniref:Iron ABC transporter permease n=1 Tax=Mycetocola tolaasinivorans TaxID=76635 RepID=A0A3L7A2R8_9MICO|nr:iron ABC transporter permease [Mycetocola tolaasinivorans]RLP74298.1 iron ABC transporter permease [Mycetocola tolaasinivorans]
MTQLSPTHAAARVSRSGRARVRTLGSRTLILIALLLLLLVLSALSLVAGSRVTSVSEVWQALSGTGNPHLQLVVTERIPRTIIGAVVGASLAVAGVIVQGITRNPLGDPGLLGVSVGASAAVVTATAITGTAIGAGTVWVALAGALATVVLVVLVAGRPTAGGIVPLLLAGAVVSAVLGTYIQAMILTRPAVFDSFRFWVIGSLSGRRLETLAEVAPALILGLVLALILASGLNALALGDDMAHSLGVSVPRVRAGGLLAAALLCAGATALVGPIAFIGLAVPHIVRALVGTDHRWQIPAAILLGASVLIAADIVGRIIARPGELMVGVVTAFVGAPFLLIAVRAGRAVRG